MLNSKKILIILSSLICAFVFLSALIYTFFIPYVLKQDYTVRLIEKTVSKYTFLDVQIQKPNLKTYLKPKIDFGVEKLLIKNKKETLVDIQEFDISLSYKIFFNKGAKLNTISAKKFIINLDEILKLIPQNKKQEQKSNDFNIDFYNAQVKLDYLKISYLQNKTFIEIMANNVSLLNKEDFKVLDFNSKVRVLKNKNKYLDISFSSDDKIKLYKDKFAIEDLRILINDSKLKINSVIDKKNIKINAKSPDFKLKDIFNIINTDLIINDGEKMLTVLNNPKGSVKFDIGVNNNDINGVIFVDNTKAQIKDLTNLPIDIQKGKILINKYKIEFVGLEGFWGKSKNNKVEITGEIKDYYKTFDSNIVVKTIVNNEFFKDYLAKLINNTTLSVSKPQKTVIIYKAKNNIMDITWLAKISKGVNLGLDSQESKLINFDRAIKGDFRIENNNLEIKNINYYIAPNIYKGVKIQPVIKLAGKMDLSGKIDNLGFSFDREIPCEFLNIFTKEKTFQKGTIKGDLFVKFKNDIPYLNSNLTIYKTLIPKERVFIKKAQLVSNDKTIDAKIDGYFKRIKFNFDGKIKNELKAPYVVKNLNLDIDKIDVEKFISSLNQQQENKTEEQSEIKVTDKGEVLDDEYMFDTNLLRIEDCDFSLKEGTYKDIKFGNIKAELTLDENGILNIHSNRFNIAEGISTLKVRSDLKNLQHEVKLGVKDVNSNLMSKAILNLENEISGIASGFIILNTDKSMKLNGNIKFSIKDGSIAKIGLVEYLLKMVTLFRNPIVVVNPATIFDIVSVPDGRFEKIKGEITIKDNIVQKIDVKSYADNLAALIRGRIDLERHDASIRVYTKITEGKTFLRNISLGSLANKVQMNFKNDENYYSSEIMDIPEISSSDNKTQIYLTNIEGDIERNNFISSLKRIK